MTIGYVREILTPKLYDRVLTPYGKGVVTRVDADATTEICLYFGRLYCRDTNFIHKILSVKEYQSAMDKLEEYRQSLLEMECQEKQVPCDPTSCVICLLTNPRKRRPLRRPKVQICDVCGNPVCLKHKDTLRKDNGQHFCMCFDCKKCLDFDSVDVHSQSLHDKVVRWITVYDRMVIQLSFCINEICSDVADKLSSLQSNGSKVKIGASAASFVSGGLAVAGTLTLLTPAGVPLLIAAIATSGASTAMQMGNTAFQYTSAKQANQLADRIIGWHGLCMGILGALSRLRDVLIKEPLFRKDSSKTRGGKKNGKLISLNSASRATSMGLRATSVVAYTPASAYSSLLKTSLTVTPVFGAALSLGIMACDAQNIHATIRKLQKPSDMALALVQIQKNFPTCIPTTVEEDALLILQVVRELEWLERQAATLTQSSSLSDRSRDSFSPNTSSHPASPNMYMESDDLPRSCMDAKSPPSVASTCDETTDAYDESPFLESAEFASNTESIHSRPSSERTIASENSTREEKKDTNSDLDDVKMSLSLMLAAEVGAPSCQDKEHGREQLDLLD